LNHDVEKPIQVESDEQVGVVGNAATEPNSAFTPAAEAATTDATTTADATTAATTAEGELKPAGDV
jgi:hypothetical protein